MMICDAYLLRDIYDKEKGASQSVKKTYIGPIKMITKIEVEAALKEKDEKYNDLFRTMDKELDYLAREITRFVKSLMEIKSICADRIGTIKDMIYTIADNALNSTATAVGESGTPAPDKPDNTE